MKGRVFLSIREALVFVGVVKDDDRPSLGQPVLGDLVFVGLMLVGLFLVFETGGSWWTYLFALPFLAFRTARYRLVRRAQSRRRPPRARPDP